MFEASVAGNVILVVHKNCLSTYTSATQIARQLKRKENDECDTKQGKRRRVSQQPFFWKRQCFFCGEECVKRRTLVDGDGENHMDVERRTDEKGMIRLRMLF